MLLRYASQQFSFETISTIGIDFKIKYITLDDKRVQLQIWDTSGQERFRAIATSCFRGVQGFLLVYDVTNRKSFDDVKNWVRQIHEVRE